MRAALLEGCVQRVFFGRVNRAAAAVLAADGCEVSVPGGPGLLRRARAALRAARTRRGGGRRRRSPPWAGFERVVVTAAGCGSAMKEYGELLGHRRGPPVLGGGARRDRALGRARAGGRAGAARAACGSPTRTPAICARPRASPPSRARCSRRSRASSWSRSTQPDMCCGSAGIYNLLEPATARELGARKARAVLAAAPGRARDREPRLRDPDRRGAAPRGPPRPADRPPGRAGGRSARVNRQRGLTPGGRLLGVAQREGGRGEDRGDDHADPLAGDAGEAVDARARSRGR